MVPFSAPARDSEEPTRGPAGSTGRAYRRFPPYARRWNAPPLPRHRRRPAIEPAVPPSRPAPPRPAADLLAESPLSGWLAEWQPEEAAIAAARQRAAEVGVAAVDPVTGAVLRTLAALVRARSVVEVGTGAGVSTLWLLRGMVADGIVTSVDAEGEHQRLARLSLAEAGVAPARARLIAGRALEVLPRLSDGAYDLMFCDAARSENVDYLAAALRLLRVGGLVVFAGALSGGRVALPSARDADTVAARELAKTVKEEDRLAPVILPVGAGLLVAVHVG